MTFAYRTAYRVKTWDKNVNQIYSQRNTDWHEFFKIADLEILQTIETWKIA